jgi:hypothetical protein
MNLGLFSITPTALQLIPGKKKKDPVKQQKY